MVLETSRLIMREMNEQDFDALHAVWGDPEVMKHYPQCFDEAKVHEWIQNNRMRYEVFGFGLWAVVQKETGEVIGDCGLTMQVIHGQIKPEIGYHIRKDQQRKGYAKEASIAVRDWTFRHTPFNIVVSYMKKSNEASAKTAMAYGGELVEEYENENHETIRVYAMTRSKWEQEMAL